MAQKHINYGTPNGKDGDFVRDAFIKSEDNFTELYERVYGDEDNLGGGIANGDGTYTWLRYAEDENGLNMTNEALPISTHIGVAYNQESKVESDDPADYTWGLIGGAQLDANGNYTWIKYADAVGDTFVSGMSDNPIGKAWIGLSVNNTEGVESTEWEDYDWTKVSANGGENGVPIAGTTKYAWFKYSEYSNGYDITNTPSMVDDPTYKTIYVGIAYNKDTVEESNLPTDYRWSLISSDIQQIDGKWTWIKYADTPFTGMSDLAEGKTYIGFAFDKDTKESEDTDSLLYESYQWSSMTMGVNGGEEGEEHQDNKVRIVKLHIDNLQGGVITEETIANYANEIGVAVTEIENIIFEIDGIEEVTPPPVNVLDNTLPLSLAYSNLSFTTVDFSWDNNGDIAIVKYKLIITRVDNGETTITDFITGTTNSTVGLVEDTWYRAKVIAYGSNIEDVKESNTVTFQMLVNIPITQPNIYEVPLVKTQTEVTVGWNIDSSFNASYYKLFQVGIGEIFSGDLIEKQVTGLTANTLYQFYVIAYKSDDTPSIQSVTLDITTLPVVIAPLVAPTIVNIDVTHEAADFTFNNNGSAEEYDDITQWLLYYRIKTPTNTGTWTIRTKNKIEGVYTQIGLLASTLYEFKLTFDTDSGTSPDSATIEVQTLPTNLLVGAKIDIIENNDPTIHTGQFEVFRGEPNGKVSVLLELTNSSGSVPISGVINTPYASVLSETIYTKIIEINLDIVGVTETNATSENQFNLTNLEGGLIHTLRATIISSTNGVSSSNYFDTAEFKRESEDIAILPSTTLSDCSNLEITIKNTEVTSFRNGDLIPEVTDDTEWFNTTEPAWCYYNNDPLNGDKYGKLYNVHAILDPRHLAPEGWRIPTELEVRDCFNKYAYKSIGYTYWDAPNTGAENKYGVDFRGAGYRLGELPGFSGINELFALATFGNLNPHIIVGVGSTYQAHNISWGMSIYDKKGISVRFVRDI